LAEFTSELITWLKTRTAITALIGSSTGARIYPERPKQNAARPYLVVTQSGGQAFTNLAGRSRIKTAIYDFIAVGDSRYDADNLASVLHAELTPADKTMGAFYVTDTVCDLDRDAGDDLPQDGSDFTRYWARSNYRFFLVT
jgi:hypothetical protein